MNKIKRIKISRLIITLIFIGIFFSFIAQVKGDELPGSISSAYSPFLQFSVDEFFPPYYGTDWQEIFFPGQPLIHQAILSPQMQDTLRQDVIAANQYANGIKNLYRQHEDNACKCEMALALARSYLQQSITLSILPTEGDQITATTLKTESDKFYRIVQQGYLCTLQDDIQAGYLIDMAKNYENSDRSQEIIEKFVYLGQAKDKAELSFRKGEFMQQINVLKKTGRFMC